MVEPVRYIAFISYSHRDAAFARWLHRALETFRVPRQLVGRTTASGAVPARLTPIFRDRDELAVSASLTAKIEAALFASRHLIVLGSPAAAVSRWVDTEVLAFKRHHGERCVIAAIVSGEPFATDPADECFPPALRFRLGADGAPGTTPAEPIAADFRASGDGRRLGLLKLIAGMLDIGLDELVQREAQRRYRRVATAAAVAIAGMAVTSGLAVVAVQARNSAEREREQAEGLIEFMLTDLRAKLEPVGRLDVLGAVGNRALGYYAAQRADKLDADALGRRSRALLLIGEVANLRGDLDGAERVFATAAGSTAEELRRHPDDPQRVFDHAQSVFWVGNIAWQRGRLEPAETAFNEYRSLAERLVRADPGNAKWLAEIDYASSNLGTLMIDHGRYVEARAAFLRSLAVSRQLLAREPESRERMMNSAQSYAWLADAEARLGQLASARARRAAELGLYDAVLRRDRRDAGVQRSRAHALGKLARLALDSGNVSEALRLAGEAAAQAETATAVDPANADLRTFAVSTLLIRAQAELAANDVEAARATVAAVRRHFDRLRALDASKGAWRESGLTLALVAARLALADGRAIEARSVLAAARGGAAATLTPCPTRNGLALAMHADLIEGDARRAQSDRDGAAAAWHRSIARAGACGGALEPQTIAIVAAAYTRLGAAADAAPLRTRLAAMEFAAIP